MRFNFKKIKFKYWKKKPTYSPIDRQAFESKDI